MKVEAEKREQEKRHDGTRLPPERWGRDHRSTMLYIETRITDHGGKIEASSMRTRPDRPKIGEVEWREASVGNREYPTRLADGSNLFGHDDWDCVEDFVEAGLVLWNGTGIHPILGLTDDGWKFAHALRRERAEKRATPLAELLIDGYKPV